jgi:hypothetical protein
VLELEALRGEFGAVMHGADNALSAANQLCRACVDLLEVDGASISLSHEGSTRGTFGSSGELSRRLDEYEFTFGEGPGLDAVASRRPVLVPDLADPAEQRWPAFRDALTNSGVSAVFALPVTLSSSLVGVLELFNREPGRMSPALLAAGLLAAELAALPLLDLMTATTDWDAHSQSEYGWGQLASLQRVEVYQATGMIIAAMNVSPTEALVRLRGLAYARGMTASELAWEIVERRVPLAESDDWGRPGPDDGRLP